MTLTELKYIVAVAREKHFGKGADACHVSQPPSASPSRSLRRNSRSSFLSATPMKSPSPRWVKRSCARRRACWSRPTTSVRSPSAARTAGRRAAAGGDLHDWPLPAAGSGAPGDCAYAANAADAAGELHRQAAGGVAQRRDRLRHPGRAFPGHQPGDCAAV